ncbi:EAL domain-containing protein [Acidobacteria bacterium AB60]|nr:EAL domain-containing protein [Acidobacteria bacterium AB60]
MSPSRRSTWLLSVILLSAIAFGAGMGAVLLPSTAVAYLRSFGDIPAYAGAAAGTLVFAVLIPLLLIKAVLRQRRVDQYLLDAFLEFIPDNVFFKDLDSRFVRVSNSMAKYCGLASPAHAAGKTDADIFTGEHAGQALEDEREIIRTGQAMAGKEEKETWPDGRETWALTTKVPMKDGRGNVVGTMGISHDITERKQAELRVQHLAWHDSLTGLPNRLRFEEQLKRAIASARSGGTKLAVLLFDLDRFKYVNESQGYCAGDRLLETVAERLKQGIRGTDTLARMGGDEFALALSGVETQEDVERVAQKLLAIIAEPLGVDKDELRLTSSVGIAQFPENAENPEVLLRLADAALNDAKKKGRGRIAFFSPNLTEATQRQRRLEHDIVDACNRDEFVIHYQPIVSSTSGAITAMEALLRWKHPRHGLIAPDQFIPLLEEMGLMVETGKWVLRMACRQAAEWRKQGLPPIRMAVNVSTQQFYEGNLVDAVESALKEARLDPRQLELEVTESRNLDASEATVAVMRRIRSMGVSFSLDDFGTGWSSLSYLRQLPLDRIKIDRTFVRDLETQATARAMVKSILGMAQNLGFSAIAEGVETAEQKYFLSKLNCPEMQGYLFSKPVPATDATALLRGARSMARAV